MSKLYATVGRGTEEERKIEIVSQVRFMGNDERMLVVSELYDGSYCIDIVNDDDTGRTCQNMWLTKESLVLLCTTIKAVLQSVGITQEHAADTGLIPRVIDFDGHGYIFDQLNENAANN